MKRLLIVGSLTCLALASCGLDVMYADWKVNQLCATDGGVTVFVTDVLPDELKKADGSLDVTALRRSKPGQAYYLNQSWTQIQAVDPVITRSELQLVRSRDQMLLAKSVIYIRPTQNVGVPLLSRSAHVCPSFDDIERMAAATFTGFASTK